MKLGAHYTQHIANHSANSGEIPSASSKDGTCILHPSNAIEKSIAQKAIRISIVAPISVAERTARTLSTLKPIPKGESEGVRAAPPPPSPISAAHLSAAEHQLILSITGGSNIQDALTIDIGNTALQLVGVLGGYKNRADWVAHAHRKLETNQQKSLVKKSIDILSNVVKKTNPYTPNTEKQPIKIDLGYIGGESDTDPNPEEIASAMQHLASRENSNFEENTKL